MSLAYVISPAERLNFHGLFDMARPSIGSGQLSIDPRTAHAETAVKHPAKIKTVRVLIQRNKLLLTNQSCIEKFHFIFFKLSSF